MSPCLKQISVLCWFEQFWIWAPICVKQLCDEMIFISQLFLTLVNESVTDTGAVEHNGEQMYDDSGSRVCDLCPGSVASDGNGSVCKSWQIRKDLEVEIFLCSSKKKKKKKNTRELRTFFESNSLFKCLMGLFMSKVKGLTCDNPNLCLMILLVWDLSCLCCCDL